MANREIDAQARAVLLDGLSYWDDEGAIDWYGSYDPETDKVTLHALDGEGNNFSWTVQLIPD